MESNIILVPKILFEDKHVIVVMKPPTIPSQSDKTNDEDMVKILKKHLIAKNPQIKDPYLGVIHRLDRPVGGVMVFTKTEFATSKLNDEIRLKRFKKIYNTIVCGKPENIDGELRNFLVSLRTVNMSKVTTPDNKNAKEAVLSYKTMKTIETQDFGTLSLLKVQLHTGRHHQIRVQLSNAGLPIWGDNKYNKRFVKMKTWTQIALWAVNLSFQHPKEKKNLEFESIPDFYPFDLFRE